jgi:hypothetical protein
VGSNIFLIAAKSWFVNVCKDLRCPVWVLPADRSRSKDAAEPFVLVPVTATTKISLSAPSDRQKQRHGVFAGKRPEENEQIRV